MMNNELNSRIIDSTKRLFQTTFSLDVEDGEPFLVNDDSDTEWNISGVMSVAGAYTGLLAIRFGEGLPEKMLKAANMTQMSSELRDRLKTDMVGELTNIIAGNTLSELSGDEVMLSIPVTIQGKKHILSWSMEPEITVIPFYWENERFIVATEIREQRL